MAHDVDEGLFGLEGRRLLLVEDNRACADAVRHWLEVCGAQVTTAGTVGGALARVRHGAPDLMVVDIQLPDGTGWDLVDRMRAAVPGASAVPVVAITGASRGAVDATALAHGVRHVVTKPIAPAALAAALTDCLGTEA